MGDAQMNDKEISSMRLKQLLVTNILIIISVILFFTVVKIASISGSQFPFIVGILLAFQGIVGLVRGDTTKSLIPIFEKVAVYEKGKMGSEWYKERKTTFIWNIILGGFMFMQSYWNRRMPEQPFEWEIAFLITFLFIVLLVINIASIIRFRKIDSSISSNEFKGYTRKSNVIGVVIGIVFAIILGIITVSFVL